MSKVQSMTVHGCHAIYFFQVCDDGPIKVGRVLGGHKEVHVRFRSVLTSSPFSMKILGIIPRVTPRVEKELHREFAHTHVRGEWFLPTREILEFIANHAEPWDANAPTSRRRFRTWEVGSRDVKFLDFANLRHPEPGRRTFREDVKARDNISLRDELIRVLAVARIPNFQIAAVFNITDRQVLGRLRKMGVGGKTANGAVDEQTGD